MNCIRMDIATEGRAANFQTEPIMKKGNATMPAWFYYAIGAAVLCSLIEAASRRRFPEPPEGAAGSHHVTASIQTASWLAYPTTVRVAQRGRQEWRGPPGCNVKCH